MVDQLADDLADQAVVFLEQDIHYPLGNRLGRWQAAFGNGSAYYPLVMVSSGHQVGSGYSSNLYDYYKGMVEAERERPPQADLKLYSWRTGDRLSFSAQVTNLSGVPLSTEQNNAAFSAIVYEDIHLGVTSRLVRAVATVPLDAELAPGGTATLALETIDLTGVDWDKLHALGLVDYRPGGSSGAFDMLQATWASGLSLAIKPGALVYFSGAETSGDLFQQVILLGPSSFTWTASSAIPWITVLPSSGDMSVGPLVVVRTSTLENGWQNGTINFTASNGNGLSIAQNVEVRAYKGIVSRINLPIILN